MQQLSIGFVGTGRIARALISGLVNDPANRICGYDKDPDAIAAVVKQFGIEGTSSTAEVARDARIIILAVKPYQIEEVVEELRPHLTTGHLLISVAAGITSEFIRQHSIDAMRVIRVMPNTPAFTGQGMTAVSKGIMATQEDIALATTMFSAIGRVAVLDERLMDAATAVSGSGPAYMFSLIASIAEGGRQCGLSMQDAILLSAQTMLGAATMVLNGEKTPEELIREVTTPGGTTEAGLKQMDAHHVRQAMIETVKAAATRSNELKQ
ncbi:pyrroline-5-carboxylate reductase [Prosthecochloris sp. ZM]|uniref:pyrroline-5-carboxylate reductase n=1 Tax=Prosthecochloris sp. ZM TaxID=2283143 RepID=UPI000DF7D910|nr:pyrroline-5-carboxylate reductase [Prosthecochloris sp. ZM]RDD29354.1 pyrroline-5-carboxylate reductase [Prosthecochloris sp. ZM]